MVAEYTRRDREAEELEAMIRRTLRSLVRRAHRGDTTALEALHRLEGFTAVAVAEGMRVAHESRGGIYSWSDLANALGLSRQGVRQRATGGTGWAVERVWLMAGLHRYCTHPGAVPNAQETTPRPWAG